MVEILHILNRVAMMATYLHIISVQQVLSSLPLHRPSQTDGGQEKHRIRAFCLSGSLMLKAQASLLFIIQA